MCEQCDATIFDVDESGSIRQQVPASEPVVPEPPPPNLRVLTPEMKAEVIANTLQYAEAVALKDWINVVANRNSTSQEAIRVLRHRYAQALRVLGDLREEFGEDGLGAAPRSALPDWLINPKPPNEQNRA